MEKQPIPLFAVPSEGLGLRDLPPNGHGTRSPAEAGREGGCGCDRAPACAGYEGCGPDSMGLCERPLAMVYAPCQYYRALYDPATALSRGTLFTELDLPLGCDEAGFTTPGCGCRYDRNEHRDHRSDNRRDDLTPCIAERSRT